MKVNLKVAIGITFLFILFFCLLIPINNARKESIVKRAAERTKVTKEQMAELAEEKTREEKEIALKKEQTQQEELKNKYKNFTNNALDDKLKECWEGIDAIEEIAFAVMETRSGRKISSDTKQKLKHSREIDNFIRIDASATAYREYKNWFREIHDINDELKGRETEVK